MAYRESVDASSARIQALEHEVAVLRAAAVPVPVDTRLTTPRERELTHELQDARRQIEELRHDEGLRTSPARRPIPPLPPIALAVAAILAAVLVFAFSLLPGE